MWVCPLSRVVVFHPVQPEKRTEWGFWCCLCPWQGSECLWSVWTTRCIYGVCVCSVCVPAGNMSSFLLGLGGMEQQQQQPPVPQAVKSRATYFSLKHLHLRFDTYSLLFHCFLESFLRAWISAAFEYRFNLTWFETCCILISHLFKRLTYLN